MTISKENLLTILTKLNRLKFIDTFKLSNDQSGTITRSDIAKVIHETIVCIEVVEKELADTIKNNSVKNNSVKKLTMFQIRNFIIDVLKKDPSDFIVVAAIYDIENGMLKSVSSGRVISFKTIAEYYSNEL